MKSFIFFIFSLLLVCSCSKTEIEYQRGYPSTFADNWIVFEFRGGNVEGELMEPYSLTTALDPNRDSFLIIDHLYDSDLRVRVPYTDSSFTIDMAEQLEAIGTENYNIRYISINGYITSNPVLTDFVYDLATYFYNDLSFYSTDIEDVLFIRAGFYDKYEYPVDTVLMLGYRETGFENVEY